MKKPDLSRYKAGSAELVVAHAAWRRSRGRRPSMSFGEEGNPIQALVTASFLVTHLLFKRCKNSALQWLNYLRNSTPEQDRLVGFVREDLRKGGLSLADIGTDEEELEELQVKCHKTRAVRWLGYLRNGFIESYFIDYIRGSVSSGDFSLADIGTSEEELSSFAQVLA